jgi:hypothetical protein
MRRGTVTGEDDVDVHSGVRGETDEAAGTERFIVGMGYDDHQA